MNSSKPVILGIGEVLWDMLPDGKRCGGAPANVVYHLTQLGNQCAVVSAVGCDEMGDELLDFLHTKGLATDFIARNNLPTGIVNVCVKNGIPEYEICHPVAWDAIVVEDSFWEIIPNVATMIWGTLAQRDTISHQTIRKIITAANSDCIKCFDINLRQNYYSASIIDESLKLANVLKINDEELFKVAELFGITGSMKDIIESLYWGYELKYVICTLGSNGSMLFDGTRFTCYPIKPCTVVDTVGCGDAFLAAWCNAILHGKSAQEGMLAGTERSAIVAEHAGAME